MNECVKMSTVANELGELDRLSAQLLSESRTIAEYVCGQEPQPKCDEQPVMNLPSAIYSRCVTLREVLENLLHVKETLGFADIPSNGRSMSENCIR